MTNSDRYIEKLLTNHLLLAGSGALDCPLTQSLVLSAVSSKNQSLLTLNFPGESHEKGLPEDANMKASEGGLCPLEAFFVLRKSTIKDLE